MKLFASCTLALVTSVLSACLADVDPTPDPTPVEEAVARKVTCPETQACIIGYTWDSQSCQCVPQAKNQCGPSLTCHGNDHCCAPDPAHDSYYCAAAAEVCQ